MSNLLGTLVDRVIAPQQTVQPRLRSLYEPADRWSTTRPHKTDEPAAASSRGYTSAASRPPREVSSVAPTHADSRDANRERDYEYVAAKPSASNQPSERESLLVPVQPRALVPSSATTQPHDPPANSDSAKPSIADQANAFMPSDRPRSRESAQSLPLVSSRVEPKQGKAAATPAPVETEATAKPVDSPRPSPKPVISPRTTIARTAGVDRANQPRRGESSGLATPQPPDVHVTIGRVEIRAIVDQPAASRRAPAAPARQSLADYLKSRQGGGRS